MGLIISLSIGVIVGLMYTYTSCGVIVGWINHISIGVIVGFIITSNILCIYIMGLDEIHYRVVDTL